MDGMLHHVLSQSPAAHVHVALTAQVSGSNVPLPHALIKMLVNYIMPSVLQKVFLAGLPAELGHYVLTCGEAIHVSGASPCL
jgi:hypothetical protein